MYRFFTVLFSFKDRESETSASALFEILTDSGFYECFFHFQRIFHIFFLMSHQLQLFVRGNRYFWSDPLLVFTVLHTNWHFYFFFVKSSANPLIKVAGRVDCQFLCLFEEIRKEVMKYNPQT